MNRWEIRSGTVGKKEERPIMMACFRHFGCQGHIKETHLPSSKPYKLVEIPEPKQMFENPGVDDCILGVVRYMQPILVSCSEPFFNKDAFQDQLLIWYLVWCSALKKRGLSSSENQWASIHVRPFKIANFKTMQKNDSKHPPGWPFDKKDVGWVWGYCTYWNDFPMRLNCCCFSKDAFKINYCSSWQFRIVLREMFFPTCQVRVVRFYVSLFSFSFSFSASASAAPPSPCRTSTTILCVQCGVSDLNCELVSSVWRAGPQPGARELSVACRTSTAIPRVQCGVPDPNRDHASPVWRAGPQRRAREFSVACRTPTAILWVQCGVPDLKYCVRKFVRKNDSRYVRKIVRTYVKRYVRKNIRR